MNKIITNYCYDSIVDKIRSFLNLSASLQQDQAIFFKYI